MREETLGVSKLFLIVSFRGSRARDRYCGWFSCPFQWLNCAFHGARKVRCGFLLLRVLHDQGNAAIGRIQRLVFLAQPLIREAAHLRDLISPDSVLHHQAARGISAVSGEFPIPVATALRVLL